MTNKMCCNIGLRPNPTISEEFSTWTKGLELNRRYKMNREEINTSCLWIWKLLFDFKKINPKKFMRNIHNSIEPSWLPHADVILKNNGSSI